MPTLALAFAAVACGGGSSVTSAPAGDASTSAPSATAPNATAPKVLASAELARLRAALDRARSAAPAENVRSATGTEPLGALVGLTQQAIRANLGEPHTCERNDVRDANGKARPVAPCQSNDDWFYSFYHLPENTLGGGPELLLTFDSARVCRSAVWLFTQ